MTTPTIVVGVHRRRCCRHSSSSDPAPARAPRRCRPNSRSRRQTASSAGRAKAPDRQRAAAARGWRQLQRCRRRCAGRCLLAGLPLTLAALLLELILWRRSASFGDFGDFGDAGSAAAAAACSSFSRARRSVSRSTDDCTARAARTRAHMRQQINILCRSSHRAKRERSKERGREMGERNVVHRQKCTARILGSRRRLSLGCCACRRWAMARERSTSAWPSRSVAFVVSLCLAKIQGLTRPDRGAGTTKSTNAR